MAQLDVRWLNVFLEIYKTRSVSTAAEHLHLAQARASGVLNKLRRYFGDPLFARTSRGMEPTPYAQQLYPDILLCVERLSVIPGRRSFDPAKARRDFHVCMTDISEIVVLPMLVNELRRVAPGITIEAERISSDSPRRLEAGNVDLAVGYMPQLEGGFYEQTLFQETFVCLAAKDHPRVRARLSKQSFVNEGHIVVTTSGTGHTIVDRELVRRRIKRAVALRVSSFLGVARIVAETELLAVVPRKLGESLAARDPVNVLAPPVPLPSYAVKLHWHERFHADAGNIWLRKVLANLLAR